MSTSTLPPSAAPTLFEATCQQYDRLAQLAENALKSAQDLVNPEAAQVLRFVIDRANARVHGNVLARRIELASDRLLASIEAGGREDPLPRWLQDAATQLSAAVSRARHNRLQLQADTHRPSPAHIAHAQMTQTSLWLNVIQQTLDETVMSKYANSASCDRARKALTDLHEQCENLPLDMPLLRRQTTGDGALEATDGIDTSGPRFERQRN